MINNSIIGILLVINAFIAGILYLISSSKNKYPTKSEVYGLLSIIALSIYLAIGANDIIISTLLFLIFGGLPTFALFKIIKEDSNKKDK